MTALLHILIGVLVGVILMMGCGYISDQYKHKPKKITEAK